MSTVNIFNLLFGLLCCLSIVAGQSKLRTVFSWNVLDWEYPNQELKAIARRNGGYVPENGLPVGIERWNNKLFVSVPRWRDGIPATLNYIDLNETAEGLNVPLKPYRGFENNIAGDCENGLSTVYRIKADECDRLWVLDVGTIGIGDDTVQACPYAINIFDLRTDTRIRRYEFRPEDTNANTFIANTLIEVGATCNDAHAYFSDELGYGLIVYSFEENTSWRFEHGFFFPDPLRGDFNIGGLNFQWAEEGIFGMALGPKLVDGTRALFFSPLASHREFYVSTEVLKDKNNVEGNYAEFRSLNERAEPGHTTARVIDPISGVMLFNLIDQNAVGCWNSRTFYEPANHGVVDRDDVAMIFPADVKVDFDRQVWVISDRMPNFLITSLDPTDINFRIFTAPLDFLIAGTVCAGPEQLSTVGNRFSQGFSTANFVGSPQQQTTGAGNSKPTNMSQSLSTLPTNRPQTTPKQASIGDAKPLGVESFASSLPVASNNLQPRPVVDRTNENEQDNSKPVTFTTVKVVDTPPTRASTFRQPTATYSTKKPSGGYHGGYNGGYQGNYHNYHYHHGYGYGHDHGSDVKENKKQGQEDYHGFNYGGYGGNKKQGRELGYRSWLW